MSHIDIVALARFLAECLYDGLLSDAEVERIAEEAYREGTHKHD